MVAPQRSIVVREFKHGLRAGFGLCEVLEKRAVRLIACLFHRALPLLRVFGIILYSQNKESVVGMVVAAWVGRYPLKPCGGFGPPELNGPAEEAAAIEIFTPLSVHFSLLLMFLSPK